MNEILQKRIEEAARYYLLHEHKSPLNEILHQCDLKTEMQYHRDIEQAYIEGGKNSLQNQWISVEEALPEKIKDKNYSKYVLARQEYYEHEYHVIARYDYGFNMWVSTYYFKPEFITHWMSILSLKGEEK